MFGQPELSPHRGPLPLISAATGRSYRVVEITGGHGMRRRLCEMGFAPGEVLTVSGGHGGALIVKLLDHRLMLSRGMARRVMVTPL